ncbi:unnamed protein product [Ectocarpus sp. CCAP 1310/34]|nr:unnamed protein product [Ectocarpus sp. CCAP 1310/34]
MATGSSGEIRRGFAKFSGDPGDYVGWRTLQTSLFMEDKLHKAYAPIGSSYNGDGRGVFLALDRKYQAAGVYRTQELHEKFISLAVTADHDFDPANVIQDMRRICTELAVYNDTVADHRKTFAFLKALPDDHYKEFKTGLLCGQAAGSVLSFEEVADRATSFHAMHIRVTTRTMAAQLLATELEVNTTAEATTQAFAYLTSHHMPATL